MLISSKPLNPSTLQAYTSLAYLHKLGSLMNLVKFHQLRRICEFGQNRQIRQHDRLTWVELIWTVRQILLLILPNLSHLSPWQNFAKFIIFVVAWISGHTYTCKCMWDQPKRTIGISLYVQYSWSGNLVVPCRTISIVFWQCSVIIRLTSHGWLV